MNSLPKLPASHMLFKLEELEGLDSGLEPVMNMLSERGV